MMEVVISLPGKIVRNIIQAFCSCYPAATTDIVFAVDSIPAVFGITQNKQVIYTSNIFAVLVCVHCFSYCMAQLNNLASCHRESQVWYLVGLKMLAENVRCPTVGFDFIVGYTCLCNNSIIYSVLRKEKRNLLI